jgi:aminomethyltransferase
MPTQPRTTALHANHLKSGARMVDFAGWEMPIQYSGILEEHRAVRTAAGLFDISHMGQILVAGPAAAPWLDRMVTCNVGALAPAQARYGFLLNDRGGVIDDLFVYRMAPDQILLVVNASRAEEDFALLRSHAHPEAHLDHLGGRAAGLALQGPAAVGILAETLGRARELPPRNGVIALPFDGEQLLLARTGYTGEDGFEIFLPAGAAPALWDLLLERGASAGLRPCGLGARDTLRMEACYPLNGNDLSPEITPLEAGLGWAVALDKPEFPGRAPLVRQREQGVGRKWSALTMDDKSPPPRAHYPVFSGGEQVAELSSGTLSPTLGIGIGLAYLSADLAAPGTALEIGIRDKRFRATVQKKPLYKRSA